MYMCAQFSILQGLTAWGSHAMSARLIFCQGTILACYAVSIVIAAAFLRMNYRQDCATL